MTMVNGKIEGNNVINNLNINIRKVLQKDIDYLNLNKLSFKKGKANLGALNNRLFTKEGDEK